MKSTLPKKHLYSLTFTVIIIFLTIISTLYLGIKLEARYQATYEGPNNILLIEKTINTIIYVDEVLTMSTRMAAFTSDLSWESRYNNIVDTLNVSINKAIEISPQAAKAFREVDEANQALIQMETEAFTLIKASKKEEAQSLLLGTSYTLQKETYSQGVKLALDALSNRKRILKDTLSESLFFFTWVIIFLIILLIIESIILYTLLRSMHTIMLQEYEKLQSANNAKSIFLSSMSHEIRTPLNGILGFAKLLDKSKLNTQQQEYVNIINNSSSILLGIISDILDVSKIENKKLDLLFEPTSIDKICKDIYALYQANAKEKSINLLISEDINEAVVLVDELRLKQILSNLLSNAIKFTPKGNTVTLEVSSEVISYSQISFIFSVKDTGIGMTEETLLEVLKPFTQANNYTTKKYGGTGLGLTISNKLLSLMNSELLIKSEEKKGSTFSFELLLQTSDLNINEEKIEINIKKSLNILVVEDNPTNQMLMQILLEELNQKCTIANNGQIGVETYQDGNFDIILMDINMPVLNGIEATKKIRTLEKTNAKKRIPIIALTANAFESDKEDTKKAGMDGFLSKPINNQKLIEALNNISLNTHPV